MHEQEKDASPGATVTFRKKLVLFAALAVIILVGYTQFRHVLTLEALAEQEAHLREMRYAHPVVAYGVAFLIYAAVTGLSLPGATVLTLAYGWFFGVVRGVVLVSLASTAGATLAFLLSRYFFRDAVQGCFGDRLERFNERLRRDGPFYLFTLRLIPAVPFFVINAVMGLTPIKTWTFWWVSQLGMLPGTSVYVYAGSSVPTLRSLANDGIESVFAPDQLTRILTAFALLGLLPLVVRFAIRRFGNSTMIDGSGSTHNARTST